MDLLLILTYAGICIAIFKIFNIPLNKWTVPTAVLGGIVLIGTLLLLMNYNHPYSGNMRNVFRTVPIVPYVKGQVVAIEAKPNTPLKKGDVLFRIDPEPYQYAVDQKRAELAQAKNQFAQDKALLDKAIAVAEDRDAERKRSFQSYERYRKGQLKDKVFSDNEVENRRLLWKSSEAAYDAAVAEVDRARIAYESNIDGVNTQIARLTAALQSAEFDLRETVVRAPTDGMVTQIGLTVGSMAVPLPLRPTMVFVPTEKRVFAAQVWQNSMRKIAAGQEVEAIFDTVPGHVFKGQVLNLLPAMSEGEMQMNGQLLSANRLMPHGFGIAIFEIPDEQLEGFKLPLGVQGKMAIYTQDFTHVAVMRRILLRMVGWLSYVYPIK